MLVTAVVEGFLIDNYQKALDNSGYKHVHANGLNVLCVESLAIEPLPVHSLVVSSAVTSLFIWPESVHRLGAHPFPFHVPIIRWRSKMTPIPVPSTTASVTSPVVTSPPVISTCPPVTSVCSTAAVTGPITMATAAPITVPSASVVPVNAPSTSVSTASESDLPTSVSPVPVPTTSSAPTFGLSTSVSTASSTPVCTPSLSISASSKKDDPGPTAFPETVTNQTTARAYLKKVMTKHVTLNFLKIGAVPTRIIFLIGQ